MASGIFACSSRTTGGGGDPGGTKAPSGASAEAPPPPTFTLFAVAEMRGQIGPCGCTTDPLGDMSRTARLIQDARSKGPVLVLDAGSTLYSELSTAPGADTQAELKANLMLETFKTSLGVAAMGLGPADLRRGIANVRPPRQIANLADSAATFAEAPRIIDVGGTRIGVFGVATTEAVAPLPVTDPVAAGQAAVTSLRADGAQVVVALVQASSRRDAMKVVRGIGTADIAILGLGREAPEPDNVEPKLGYADKTIVIIPGNRGQIVSQLAVTLRGPVTRPIADAVGLAAATAIAGNARGQLASLDAELARYTRDPTSDPAFIASKRAERDALAHTAEALLAAPYHVPATGSYAMLAQDRIEKALACATDVQTAMRGYREQAGAANVAAARGTPLLATATGAPTYVGMETCEDCHAEEVEVWKGSGHAHAWETLVATSQQFDYECIGCHTTGWQQPGGATMGHNDKLRDVQCETCHGPASIHVAKEGHESPRSLHKAPPEQLCAGQCHTTEHSDTFQREAYLRDIVGKGHGESLARSLGAGPHGHELREAGLARAGTKIGAGCTK